MKYFIEKYLWSEKKKRFWQVMYYKLNKSYVCIATNKQTAQEVFYFRFSLYWSTWWKTTKRIHKKSLSSNQICTNLKLYGFFYSSGSYESEVKRAKVCVCLCVRARARVCACVHTSVACTYGTGWDAASC